MTGMLLSSGIPRWLIVRVSWISPPSTSVWLFKSTTDVSASRLRNDGEFVGATAGPTELTSCLTSSATVPRSPMRGVTVRMTPASRYSTVWLTPPVVMLVLVVPPVVPGVLTVLVCWPVMIGTDCETLMMAFLFSDVITCGLLMTLTRLSEAKALRIAKNLSVAKVNPVSPPAGRPAMVVRAPIVSKPVGAVIGGEVVVDVAMDCCATLNLPARSAQSMPSCMSWFSVISATRTSISTWRGRRRGRRRRVRLPGLAAGEGRRGLRRRHRLLGTVDRVQRGREVLGLGVLREVNEHAPAARDVDVELREDAADHLDLVLAPVDHDRVRAPLGDDERRPIRHGAARGAGRGRPGRRRRRGYARGAGHGRRAQAAAR